MRITALCLTWMLAATLGANAMNLGSKTFKAGATLPTTAVYNAAGCSGQNRSPELHWSDAPKETKSFAVTVHDPDAPAPGGFDHWLAYNIAATTRAVPEGVRLAHNQQGVNGFGKAGYSGPCPPPGKPHRYIFTVYALNVANVGTNGMTGAQFARALRGHVMAAAKLTALYGRP